jgi:hypothetical protein
MRFAGCCVVYAHVIVHVIASVSVACLSIPANVALASIVPELEALKDATPETHACVALIRSASCCLLPEALRPSRFASARSSVMVSVLGSGDGAV